MKAEKIIRLRMQNSTFCRRIPVVQGDTARTFRFILEDITLDGTEHARIYARKPSGAEVYDECDVIGSNEVIFTPETEQIFIETGIILAEIRVAKGEKLITSYSFEFEVRQSTMRTGDIPSSDEFNALERAIEEAKGLHEPEFTEAGKRENIVSGETMQILFGKIKKWFTDLGALITKIGNKDISSIGDGTVTGAITDLDKRSTKNTSDIDVERKRIDNIAKLPEGSTAGDAELADIRVAADGTSYDTAGEAVRGQINQIDQKYEKETSSLKEDLTDISEERNFVPIDVIFRDNVGKFIVHNGGISTNALYSISNLIPVELGNTKIRITFKKVNPYISRIAFLRKNVLSVENVISTFVQGSIGTFDVEIPSDAKYIAINSDTDAKGSTENEYPKVRFFPPLVNVDELDRNVKRIDKEVQDISKKLTDGNEIFRPTLNIGSTLYAIVGDTMQIFKDSIVDSFGNNYICKFECVKGRQYPRYWEYTPTASDIGETTLKISLVNASGNVIDEKTVSLITKQASNTKKNVLNIGDSTMANGEIPIELSRRLKGTNGVASTPSPLSLSNINVVGRLKNTDNSVGWEGTGGWTYSTYISSGSKAVRFVVNNASAITVGDLIRIDATNTYGYYQFQVAEVNVSNGTGNIRAVFHTTAYTEDFASKVSTSGAIKNTSGSIVGQYTSCSVESYQPFWNSETNSFDITSYVRTYCGGSVDFVFILLGINSLYKMSPWSDTSNIMSQCKTLLRNIHTQLPSAKVLLSTNHLVSQNGGLGANYDCRTSFGQFDVSTINHLLFEMNKKYYTLENDSEFSGYVKVVNTHAQFDAENAFPSMEKNVNTRATKKESVGTNGVHPTNSGYWQIADAEFRALLAN